MGQALYRKYRSRSLEEVVGQEHITQTLARALKAGRISHAYLFTGPHGVGKTSVARILAHEINQLPYSDTPHLDIIEIDAASNRRIDDIRDLRDKVNIAPISAKYKVYIIDEVHMLTGESFNALLKTLEEPPAHVVFILATTEAHKLPATIISRTQRFSFRPGTKENVAAHLKAVAEKENIAIDDTALELIAEHSQGGFRDGVSILDQVAHASDKKITAEDVAGLLGLAPQAQIEQLVQAYLAHDITGWTQAYQAIQEAGTNVATIVEQLNRRLIEAGADNPQLYTLLDSLLDVPKAYNPELKFMTVFLTNMVSPQAAKGESKNAPAMAAAPAPVTIAEAPSKPKPVPKPQPPEMPAPEANLDTFTTDDWQKLLAAIKQKNAPLYSVVKQAQPEFDASKHVLRLKFKYQLHRKKLDDAKQKAILASVMAAVLGGAATIMTEVDTGVASPPPPPADPTAASVAAIMGGGEIIDAANA